MNEKISFSRWLWDALSMPGALRSDKQKRLGSLLLFANLIWWVIPVTATLRLLFMFLQLIVGVTLLLHGYYLVGQEREERRQETLRESRTYVIKHIADRDDVSLEEAEQTYEDMEGWVRESREEQTDEALDGLELAMVKGNIQVIEITAERLGISIEEATEKVKEGKRRAREAIGYSEVT